MAVELTKAATAAMAEVELMEGETIEHVYQADGFFVGTNPMLKLMASLQAFLVTITGGHIRVFLVITNKRVLMIESNKMWCGCQAAKIVNALSTAGIKEAGIAKETKLCIFSSRFIHVQSITQRHSMVVKKFKDADLKEFLNTLSDLILAHTQHT